MMASDPASKLEPVKAGQQVVLGGVVGFLAARPMFRLLLGAFGFGLLLLGLLLAPFWSVPLLSWLSGGQVAGVSLVGGFGAIGLWHLSRPKARGTDLDD